MYQDSLTLTQLLTIRNFEYLLLDFHKRGQLSGTVHTCVGQEYAAVALSRYLDSDIDSFFATHRGHGYFIAYGGCAKSLLLEMTGRVGATVNGRGGSQHLNFKNFYSNGIQGAGASQAVGFAWANKLSKSAGISVVQLGDGTLGEGAIYEAMNFASLLSVPVLFLLEYNGWAQSTDVVSTISGTIKGRAEAFGIEYSEIDDIDFSCLSEHLKFVVEKVRTGKPYFLRVNTRRLLAHSKGDDNRDKSYIEKIWSQDPLTIWEKEFPQYFKDLNRKIKDELIEIERDVLEANLITEIGLSPLIHLSEDCTISLFVDEEKEYGNFVDELNKGLHRVLSNEDTVFLGEDINDPYGGAFKVSKGLSSKYPERIFSTPISENAIVGLSIGAALSGYKVVTEIMFADFVTLAIDQIVNSAAKYYYMFGSRKTCPVNIRLVSGGYRGYGPTHSQNTELFFCGIPGLKVLALNPWHDPEELLNFAITKDLNPKIFVEDKNLYNKIPNLIVPLGYTLEFLFEKNYYPNVKIRSSRNSADYTLVCYGAISLMCIESLKRVLFEEDLFGEIIVLTQIWPISTLDITNSVRKTKKLIVVEVNPVGYGFGSEIISKVHEDLIDCSFSSARVGALNYPIPASKELEVKVLPSADDIFNSIINLF